MYLGHTIRAAGSLLPLTSRADRFHGDEAPLSLSLSLSLCLSLSVSLSVCFGKAHHAAHPAQPRMSPAAFLLPGQGQPEESVPHLPGAARGLPGPLPVDSPPLQLPVRVLQVCNIEDWLKSSFQKDICGKHESLVSAFLSHVCRMCPNLLWLTLSGCGHITDQDVICVLQSCRKLRSLHLENCVRITDRSLEGVAAHGGRLEEVKVDFCRNVTQAGLQAVREKRPGIQLSAERSADMIPDSRPEEKVPLRRSLQKLLQFS
uniref:F-box and leucine-rich repeat protein 22 n=1 Tax=Gasterosteus aculeatus aculeatus TaxID=481459 RepID=A0AAQ4QBC2_GASAC